MPDARYGQDHFGFPSWSTATRKPVAAGAAGRNSDDGSLEFWDGFAWNKFGPARESFGAKLRRLAAAAKGNNRADALNLMPPPAWASGQTIIKGNVRSNAGSWYQAVSGGTTGATAPTGNQVSATVINDGGVNWVWLDFASVTTSDPLAPWAVTITASAATTVAAGLTNTGWQGAAFVPNLFRAYGDVWDTSSGWIGFLNGYQSAPYPLVAVGTVYALNAFAVANRNLYKLTTLVSSAPYSGALPSGTTTFVDANGNTWTYQSGAFSTSTVKVGFWVNDYAFAVVVGNAQSLNANRISIDGRYLSPDGVIATGSATTNVVLQFTTRKPRFVTWEWPQNQQVTPSFVGVTTSATGEVWLPETRDDVRAMFISDSIFDASSTYGPFIGGNQVSARVCARMGWTDCWQWALGGTGWCATNSGASRTYGQRIPDALAVNPDIWIFMGSTNDEAYPAATVTAAVLAGLQAIRNGGSTAPIVVFGVWSLSGALATEQAVQAGVAAFIDPLNKTFFIPIYQDPAFSWISGSWNYAGGAWNGNASNTLANNSSAYISADNVHPSDPGSNYLAYRMVRALSTNVLPALN